MIMWLTMAGLLTICLLVLAWALMRAQPALPETAESGMAFLQAQLDAADSDDAKREIARRMLRLQQKSGPQAAVSLTKSGRLGLLGGVAVFLLLGSMGLYGLMGSPDQPWQPRGLQTMEEITAGAPLEQLVPYMASVMRQRPDDAQGWGLLATTAANIGRHDIAATALANINRLRPGEAGLMAAWAEAQIATEGGLVTPAARDLLQQAVARDAGLHSAQYYLGLYAKQQGDPGQALAIWQALLDDGPADAPWVDRVTQEINSLTDN